MNEQKIDEMTEFTSKYFNIEKDEIFGNRRNGLLPTARQVLWYNLHYQHNVSVGKLAKKFGKTSRNIFLGIAKIKDGLKYQEYYRSLYDSYMREYDKK